MKKFFHDYFYSIIRMFVNQFAIAVFGTSLTFATTHVHVKSGGFDWLTLVVSIFAIIFYLFLIYTLTWEIGAKDRLAVDMGRKPYRPHTGVLLSLLANIPNLIFATLFLFSDLAGWSSEFIFSLASSLLQGMYFGVATAIKLPLADGTYAALTIFPLTFFVTIIPALVTCWVAYFLGFKNFRFIAPSPQKPQERPTIKK